MRDDTETTAVDEPVGRGTRWTVVVASLISLLATAVCAAIWSVSAASGGTQDVVIGTWTGDDILVRAVLASVLSLAVIVFAVPAYGRWWALLLPLRILAIGAMAAGGLAVVFTNDSVTPIVADGCETGYAVRERAFLLAASGTVIRVDGVIGTDVGHTSVDDGHEPFAQRSYIAVAEGDTLRIWNTFRSNTERLSTSSEPSFVLPRLTTETGCGLTGGSNAAAQGSPTLAPAPDSDEGFLPNPLPAAAGDSRERVAQMAALTLDASTGTAMDATGTPLRAPTAADLPCDGTTSVVLAFRTEDNESSYAAILSAWDAEGFAADRAMQEDLRYDGVVRLSARDRSTIDGLLHFSLTADCRAP